ARCRTTVEQALFPREPLRRARFLRALSRAPCHPCAADAAKPYRFRSSRLFSTLPVLAGDSSTNLRLRAGVPEALTSARVGVIPAEPCLRRRARPGRRARRRDEADRCAGRGGAAGRPAVPAGTASPVRCMP